jgi:hypothetical protein
LNPHFLSTNGKTILTAALLIGMLVLSSFVMLQPVNAIEPLAQIDPSTIPKFVDQLVIPPVYVPQYTYDYSTKQVIQKYTVDMTEFYEQILPTANAQGNPTGFGQTKVWGYGGIAKDASRENI